jgi:hypothetical protein
MLTPESPQIIIKKPQNFDKSFLQMKRKSPQFSLLQPKLITTSEKNQPKKVDVLWTFEEEYLFFETHKILKNKWTKYNDIFPENTKEMKELKNHFHSCIIKTVRRIINNKFDYKIREIMRSFYVCEYLKNLIIKMEHSSKYQMSSLIATKYKYNPKMLIQQKVLTIEIIQSYTMILLNDFLLTKPAIVEILGFLNIKKEEITLKNIFIFFSFLVTTKIIIECKEHFHKISPSDQVKIQTFIKENSNNSINLFKFKDIFSI